MYDTAYDHRTKPAANMQPSAPSNTTRARDETLLPIEADQISPTLNSQPPTRILIATPTAATTADSYSPADYLWRATFENATDAWRGQRVCLRLAVEDSLLARCEASAFGQCCRASLLKIEILASEYVSSLPGQRPLLAALAHSLPDQDICIRLGSREHSAAWPSTDGGPHPPPPGFGYRGAGPTQLSPACLAGTVPQLVNYR
jgi:hypothetical protein